MNRDKLRQQAAALLQENQTEAAPAEPDDSAPAAIDLTRDETAQPSRDPGVPPPVFRVGEATETMQFDVPGEFEPLRKAAARLGRTKTDLILDALALHGPTLLAQAEQQPLLRFQSSSRVNRWLLSVSEEEQASIETFVDAISKALGGKRKSRTAAIAKLLEQCL